MANPQDELDLFAFEGFNFARIGDAPPSTASGNLCPFDQ